MESHEQPWVTLSGIEETMSIKFSPGSKFNLFFLEKARKNKNDFINFVNGLQYEKS